MDFFKKELEAIQNPVEHRHLYRVLISLIEELQKYYWNEII